MPQLKVKARARVISAADMRKRIEKGNYKALRMIGRDVWEKAKAGIGRQGPKLTKAGTKAVKAGAIVEFVGGLYRDLTMLDKGKARPAGKPIKSWGPMRFYYNSIWASWDNGSKSVVIGPWRGGPLARLHQYGGTLTLRAWRIGVGAARAAFLERQARGQNGGRDSRGRFLARERLNRKYEYGAIQWHHGRPRHSRNWDPTTITKTARYPARPFMRGSAGVERVIARARERFRDTLPIGGSRAA